MAKPWETPPPDQQTTESAVKPWETPPPDQQTTESAVKPREGKPPIGMPALQPPPVAIPEEVEKQKGEDAIANRSIWGNVADAIGLGWGPSGLSLEAQKGAREAQVRLDHDLGPHSVSRAFNQGIVKPAIEGLMGTASNFNDLVQRNKDMIADPTKPPTLMQELLPPEVPTLVADIFFSPNELWDKGIGVASYVSGIPKDVLSSAMLAAMPARGIMLKAASDAAVIGPMAERKPEYQGTPAEAAMQAVPDLTKAQFTDIKKPPRGLPVPDGGQPNIVRNKRVQYLAGSSIDNRTVYIDPSVPTEMTVKKIDGGTGVIDPAEPLAIHETVENHEMVVNRRAYYDAHTNYATPAEHKWLTDRGFEVADYERQMRPLEDQAAKESIKDEPPDIFVKPYPHTEAEHIAHAGQPIEQAEERISPLPGEQEWTPAIRERMSRVIHVGRYGQNHAQIAIDKGFMDFEGPNGRLRTTEKFDAGFVNKKGEFLTPADMQSRGLATNSEDLYKQQAAAQSVPLLTKLPEHILVNEATKGSKPGVDYAANIRLDRPISPGAEQVLIDAAAQNGGEDAFMPARQGEIILSQALAFSRATGIPIGELDLPGIGRRLQNDHALRTALTALHMASEKTVEVAKQASTLRTPEAIQALFQQKAIHLEIMEAVSGLTAEWGRTGRVFQEFLNTTKGVKSLGEFLKENAGTGTEKDLLDQADKIAKTDGRRETAALLNKLRKFKPSFLSWYWVSSILSGLFSHAKFWTSLVTSAAFDRMLVTPIAASIGSVRQLASPGEVIDRVYYGETMATAIGWVRGAPQAAYAAARAFRDNVHVGLPAETTEGIDLFNVKEPLSDVTGKLFGVQIPGLKTAATTTRLAVGAPGRVIKTVATFLEHVGYQGGVEARTYRALVKAGQSPIDLEFWKSYRENAAHPTEEIMAGAVQDAKRMAFLTDLGDWGRRYQRAIAGTPLRYSVPFQKMPINIAKRYLEGTPMALLHSGMRAQLFGQEGAVARDIAWARLIGGAAVMAVGMEMYAHGHLADTGPNDPIDRAIWKLDYPLLNSARIGDEWHSFQKFGNAGMLLQTSAMFGAAFEGIKQGDEMDQIAARVAFGAGQIFEESLGLQSLGNLIEAYHDPARYGWRYLGSFAASWLPFSSLIGQIAAMKDPFARETYALLDYFKSKIPGKRETLFPLRDWSGTPVANSREGMGVYIAQQAAQKNPVDLEMARLGYWPGKMAPEVKGVPLTHPMYDEMQNYEALQLRPMLTNLVAQAGWYNMTNEAQLAEFRRVVSTVRKTTEMTLMAKHPELFGMAIQNRIQAPYTPTGKKYKEQPHE